MIEPSKQLQKIFDSSVEITKSYNHRLITLEHLIFAIVADKESSAGLKEYGADVDYALHKYYSAVETKWKLLML